MALELEGKRPVYFLKGYFLMILGNKFTNILIDEIAHEEERFFEAEQLPKKYIGPSCPRCGCLILECEEVCPDCWEYWNE